MPIAHRGDARLGPAVSWRTSYRPVRSTVAMAVVLGVLAAQATRTGEASWILPGLIGPVVLGLVALAHRWCRGRRVDLGRSHAVVVDAETSADPASVDRVPALDIVPDRV